MFLWRRLSERTFVRLVNWIRGSAVVAGRASAAVGRDIVDVSVDEGWETVSAPVYIYIYIYISVYMICHP